LLSNLKGYYRPNSIAQALALLEKNSGSILILAGGTKLVSQKNDIVQELVDITSLPLNYIKAGSGEVRIGATTPLQTLVESPVLRNSPAHIVSRAALLSNHSRMIRNVSTLGGELITAGPLSVLYCAFLALQGQVRIAGGEEFALAMNIFLNKKGLGGGLLVETIVPEITKRTYSAIMPILNDRGKPIICACCRVTAENAQCSDVKISITGTDRVPQRLSDVEHELEGRPFSESSIVFAAETVANSYFPVSDKFASEEYRKDVGTLVVKRALMSCLHQAEEDL